MDWKPFVCRVSCSKIKQKTCFWTEGAPIYWSLGSNIMEPGLQYIGADQIFVLQNRLVGLKYSFAITQMRFNKTQSIWIGLIQLRKGFSKIFDGLQYIGARAPLYWSLGSIILEPLRFNKHVFCFIFEHETRQTKGFQSISWAIMWYTKPGFIRALPPQSFPEFWK